MGLAGRGGIWQERKEETGSERVSKQPKDLQQVEKRKEELDPGCLIVPCCFLLFSSWLRTLEPK